jgi:two-component system, NarL family, sensor kinase
MKKKILFLLMLSFGLNSFGQSTLLDSLNGQLEEASSLEKKAETFHNIGLYFSDSMQRYRAIDHFLLAHELYEELRDTVNLAQNCSVVADNYMFLNERDEALRYSIKSLKLYESSGDRFNFVKAICDVSFVYMELNLLEKAKEYLDMALEISQELNEPELHMDVQAKIGIYYRRKKDYLSAIEWQDKALHICRLLNDEKELIEVLISAATAYGYQEEWDRSLEYLYEALELNTIHGTREYEGYLIGEIGWREFLMRKPGHGIAKIQEALNIAQEVNNMELARRAYRSLARIHFKLERFEEAYRYYAEFVIQLEKSTGLNQANAIAEMTARYDSEKKQRVIDKLKQEKELEEKNQAHEQALFKAKIDKKQNAIYFSFSALLLMALLIVVIIRNNRNKLKAKTTLASKEEEIKEQQAILKGQDVERQRIAQELHDGIGGSLSIIKMKIGDLTTVSYQDAEVVELSEDIGRACREVRSISHNLMAVDVEGENLIEAIHNFVGNLLLNTDTKVQYDLFPEKGINELDKNTKHNCYRIIQELANNAVKHAEASELTIGIILDDEGGMLRVEDNGKGFDENTMRQGGMGLKSINQRVEAINGELTLESTHGKGSIFQIHFPFTKLKSAT